MLGQLIHLSAQQSDIRFEHLSVEDGLSQRYVFEVVADCKGYLWIATEDGLNKYNGYNFEVFRHDPDDPTSLGGNILRQALESHAYGEHKLWVCTVEGGLACLDLRTERFTNFRYDPDDSTSISNNSVWIIEETNIGGIPEIWVGVQGLGLDRLDIRTGKFKRYRLGHLVTDLFYDSKGVLWVGTSRNGLGHYNPETDDFTWSVQDRSDPKSLGGRGVYDMTEDRFGTLYVGTSKSVDRITSSRDDLSEITFKHYQHDPKDPNSMSGYEGEYLFEDAMGNLWFSNYGRGMNIFHRETNTFTRFLYDPNNPHSIGSDIIFSICDDKSGIVWFGHVNGISKWDPQKAAFSRYEHSVIGPTGLENKWVTSVLTTQAGDKELIWVGTIGGGLCRYDRSTGASKWYLPESGNPNALQNNAVLTLTLSKPGQILIGTLEEVYVLELLTDRISIIKTHSGPIQSSYTGPSGFTWIAASNYVDKYDPMSGETTSIMNQRAYAVHETPYKDQSYLWVGTFRKGLLRVDLKSNDETWYTHNANDPLTISNDMVEALYTSDFKGHQVLWVGTMAGLDIYDYESETFRHYTMKDGLPHNHILDLQEDNQGSLWITTKLGLSRFNPQTETFKSFWKEDGLPSDGYEFESIHRSGTGEIFVGGDKGLVSFFPDSLKENTQAPSIVLTDFKLFHESVPVRSKTEPGKGFSIPKHISYMKELNLTYRQNIFTLEFSALDFHSPRKNQYAYHLGGFEDDWNYVDATKREVTYTNLDPGNYTFRVKGSNNDGVWNEQGVSLKIIISPPWWETQWAYLGYLLVLGGMMVAFWRFQVSKIKLRHQVELEHLAAEHYHELDEHKSRFMANISHEFRTPLTLILGPVSNLMNQIKDHDMRDDLHLIQRQAKRLLELVIQLLDISKLEDKQMILQASQQNIVPLIKGLVDSFGSLAERNTIDLKFEAAKENVQLYVEKDAMVKILNNLLSNAFKFSGAGKSIKVSLSQSPDSPLSSEGEVIIRVSDTGIGIPENHLDKVFDRFHQVDNTETRQWGGTGIGLALSKELVELHGGTISVDSNPDVGTVFTIRLPRGKQHLNAHKIVHADYITNQDSDTVTVPDLDQEGGGPQSEENRGEALPILLIVEDNLDVRNYIRGYLDKQYQCYEAVDGQDGLNRVRELVPDLVISDVMMPKMNGLEFCRQVKTDERTSHIPVLMLTAKADLDSKVKGLETGADAYLTKPFEALELKIRIKNLIDQRQALRERFQREFSLIPSDMNISSMDKQFLERAVQIISDQLSDPDFKVDSFAQNIYMSRQQLNRKLKALTGRTAVEFVRQIRLKRAAMLLQNNHATITEIAYQVGFSNPSHFSRSFNEEFGKSPSAFLSDQKKSNSE